MSCRDPYVWFFFQDDDQRGRRLHAVRARERHRVSDDDTHFGSDRLRSRADPGEASYPVW